MKRLLQTATFFVMIFLLEGGALKFSRVKSTLQLEYYVNRLMMRGVYLLIMGFLIGFLAEEERTLREKMDTSLRVLNQIDSESGLLPSVAAALMLLGDVLGSKYVACFCQRRRSERSLLFLVSTAYRSLTTIQLQEAETAQYSNLEDELFIIEKRRKSARMGLPTNKPWHKLTWQKVVAPARLGGVNYDSAISCSFDFGEHWCGRVILLDPVKPHNFRKLSLLKYVIRQTLPSIHNLYLLEQLRERASQIERSRLTRALHDSTLQALSGIRMQLEAMRLSARFPARQQHQIIHIEQLLREQSVELRALMMGRDLESFDSESLPRRIQDVVRKIAREGNLHAQFVWDGQPLRLSNLNCRELALAAQEGIANVVKHSGAKNVAVVLKSEGPSCVMTIADDGKGFPLSGSYSLAELDEASWGPLVLKERARNLGGELQLESNPDGGTTIAITVRQEKFQNG
jgi:signal transduction histidine kinase